MPAIYPVDTEFIEMARELLDETILVPNCVWISIENGVVADSLKPWVVTKGTRTQHSAKVFFTQDRLEDRQLVRYRNNTETQSGQVNGLMYKHDAFESRIGDIVDWEGRELVVRAVDAVQPISRVIIYELEFGT